MMNKERLTIEEQLEEIKDCGSKFNDVQYYCLYKYDIERIIPYIEDLQQRIDKAINDILTTFQIISEQPSRNVEEDNYILSRLEGFIKILGGDVDDE